MASLLSSVERGVHFPGLVDVGGVLGVGLAVVILAGQVGDKEVVAPGQVLLIRPERRLDGFEARVGDGARRQALAGIGVVGRVFFGGDVLKAAVVVGDPVIELVVVLGVLHIAGSVAFQTGIG